MDKNLKLLKERQNQLFSALAEIASGISSPVRITLLHFLSQGPLTVEVLAEKIDQSIANTSMHLRKMLKAKIVIVTVQGKNRLYSLHPAAFSFWEACQDFSQAIDPSVKLTIEDVYKNLNWEEEINSTIMKIKQNEVLLIDARPNNEAQSFFIKNINILNIPSNEISQNIKKLPKRKPILVFCRGRFCALSAFTVNELRKNKINAYRLNESWYSLKNMLSR